MSARILLLLLAASVAAVAAPEREQLMTLEGEVIRQNGLPLAGVTVGAELRASSFALLAGPIADREVARSLSDDKGHFTLHIPPGTNVRRLILVAGGQLNRMRSKEGDIGFFGTSVSLRNVNQRGLNRIVVPNNFQPARQRP
ncbi:MAG: hypothetical protein ACJ8NS_05280 [Chthoniobacterales bacterium]|jgi:hypothetical protein